MDIKKLIAVATGKIPHNYRSGLCPDELQPDSRDPDCPACKILIEAATEHDAMERELRAAEIRLHDVATLCANVESELEAERAKQERQKPVAYLTADKNMLVFADKCVDMQHLMTPLYAAPPVTAQAEGYVTALRYIAWEAAGYMDCVHAAKRAIGEMGALPPPPNTQPTRGEG